MIINHYLLLLSSWYSLLKQPLDKTGVVHLPPLINFFFVSIPTVIAKKKYRTYQLHLKRVVDYPLVLSLYFNGYQLHY